MSHVREKRQKLIDRYGSKCHYCKRETDSSVPALAPTIDHVLPLAYGGTNRMSNLVLACYECNHTKADNLPIEKIKELLGAADGELEPFRSPQEKSAPLRSPGGSAGARMPWMRRSCRVRPTTRESHLLRAASHYRTWRRSTIHHNARLLRCGA